MKKLMSCKADDKAHDTGIARAEAMASLFSKNTRYLRKKKGLTLRKLSAISGVSAPTLSALENGRNCPGLVTALMIAESFGVGIEEFCSKDFERFEETPRRKVRVVR